MSHENTKTGQANDRTGGNHDTQAGGNADLRGLAARIDAAITLLGELAEDVGEIAPEHKHIFEEAKAAIDDFATLLAHAPEGLNGQVTRIKAPMPGIIMRCEKKAGADVKKGDVLLVLDAMKVDNPIRVPVDGKLICVRYSEGERVSKGSVLAIVNQHL